MDEVLKRVSEGDNKNIRGCGASTEGETVCLSKEAQERMSRQDLSGVKQVGLFCLALRGTGLRKLTNEKEYGY